MARTLPPNPNLDHLKKQAKALLSSLRRRNPGAKLAEAQRAIAETYGFRDWTGIKTHVETLSTAKSVAPPAAMSPLAGVWALNAEKTQALADEAFERAIIEIVIAEPNVLLTDVVVDSAARVDCRSNELRVDGIEQSGPHGYAVVANWLENAALEVVVKKDGRTISRVTYAVSPDGLTLSVDASTLAHDGYPAVLRRIALDRIEVSRLAAEATLMNASSDGCR